MNDPIGHFIRRTLETLADGWSSFWPPGIQDVYQAFTAAVIIMAILLIPYNVAALLYHERDARIKEIRADPSKRYWPSLYYFTGLTRLFLGGMIFIIGVVILRLALQYDQLGDAPPQPAWSLALSMASSMVLLGLLSSPAIFLIRVKMRILNIHVGRRPPDRQITRGDR